MTNRRALRISNGSVIYKRDLLRFGKKNKKLEKRKMLGEQWDKQQKQFNPVSYRQYKYGAKNV